MRLPDKKGNLLIENFQKDFSRAVHLLCIEDDSILSSLLCDDIFVSPILKVKAVHSFHDAKTALFTKSLYHGWILDLTLTNYNDGLDLLNLKNNFPFCVVLTGCGSVEDATKAMKAGAYCCYDKKNLFIKTLNLFIYNICSLLALSFPLKAKQPMRMDGFMLLVNNFVQTPEEWAEKYFQTFRSVWNFCKIHSELTPKQFLSLFHSIQFILLSDCLVRSAPGYESLTGILEQRMDFYLQCLDFVLKNKDSIFAPLYL